MLLFRLFLSVYLVSCVYFSLSFCLQCPFPLLPYFSISIKYLSFFLHTYSGQDEVERWECSTEPQRRKLVFIRVPPWQTEKKNCDKYSQCQTLIACQLFEAAQWKDERLLLQIEDKDLVGLEVCYHCLCYNEYVPNSWQGQIHRMKHL